MTPCTSPTTHCGKFHYKTKPIDQSVKTRPECRHAEIEKMLVIPVSIHKHSAMTQVSVGFFVVLPFVLYFTASFDFFTIFA